MFCFLFLLAGVWVAIFAQTGSQTYNNCKVVVTGATVVITCPTSPPLVSNPVTIPAATVGVPYTADISGSCSGGTKPYKFTATSGFPAWATLSPAGVISGTPTATGTFNLSWTVTDSSAGTALVFKDVTLDAYNYKASGSSASASGKR
jgi:hypothetical protein